MAFVELPRAADAPACSAEGSRQLAGATTKPSMDTRGVQATSPNAPQRQGPGRMLSLQAPTDQQPPDSGRRRGRANAMQRRRRQRLRVRIAQRQRLDSRWVGAQLQIGDGDRRLFVGGPARQRQRPRPHRRMSADVREGVVGSEHHVDHALRPTERPPRSGPTVPAATCRQRPARGRSGPRWRRRVRAGPRASRVPRVCRRGRGSASGTARTLRGPSCPATGPRGPARAARLRARPTGSLGHVVEQEGEQPSIGRRGTGGALARFDRRSPAGFTP